MIIYDNIDRISSKKIEKTLSSIYTFFSGERYENIILLIPFSRKHLLDAFSNPEEKNQVLEKIFPIIYRITPPVLTDWKSYFNSLMKEAFKEISEEDISMVRIFFDNEKKNITPRGIKSFINELISLKLTNDNDIKLPYIALFTLFKEEIEIDYRKTIIEGKGITEYKNILGDETPKYLAAIYFGVDAEIAIQVLLKRELELAMRNGEFEKIDTIKKIKGFTETLEMVVLDLEKDSNVDAKNIIESLKNINIENCKDIENIFKRICRIFQQRESEFGFQDYGLSTLNQTIFLRVFLLNSIGVI